MLERDEYIKIKEYITDKKYEELEKYINSLDNQRLIKSNNNIYIDKQKEEDYIKNARKALLEYFRKSMETHISYIDDDKLLLTNSACVYIFNNDEILSKYRKDRLNMGKYNQNIRIIDGCKKFLEKVEKLESCNNLIITNIQEKYPHHTYEYYVIIDKDTDYVEYFNYNLFQNFIDFSDGKAKIKMYPSKRSCIIESEKGKGLICPINKN